MRIAFVNKKGIPNVIFFPSDILMKMKKNKKEILMKMKMHSMFCFATHLFFSLKPGVQ